MIVDAVDSGARVLAYSKILEGDKFFEDYVMSELSTIGVSPEDGVSDVNEESIFGNPSVPLEPRPYDPGDGTVEPQMDPFWRRRRGGEGENAGNPGCNQRGRGDPSGDHKWGTGEPTGEFVEGDGGACEKVKFTCTECGASHTSTVHPKRR